MAIQMPSQYQCNNMEQGDLIYVKQRNILYRLYRSIFQSNKTILKVRKDWTEPAKYSYYYQEDCTLMYAYEIQAMKDYTYEVPCRITLSERGAWNHVTMLQKLHIDIYNIRLTLKNGLSFTFPLSYVDSAIKHNNLIIKGIEDNRLIKDQIKYLQHKGSEFKNIVLNRNISNWTPSYCSICGKSVDFKFTEDEVIMTNNCECGCLSLNLQTMSYDQFAIWYASQINKDVRKIYDKFWFGKE